MAAVLGVFGDVTDVADGISWTLNCEVGVLVISSGCLVRVVTMKELAVESKSSFLKFDSASTGPAASTNPPASSTHHPFFIGVLGVDFGDEWGAIGMPVLGVPTRTLTGLPILTELEGVVGFDCRVRFIGVTGLDVSAFTGVVAILDGVLCGVDDGFTGVTTTAAVAGEATLIGDPTDGFLGVNWINSGIALSSPPSIS